MLATLRLGNAVTHTRPPRHCWHRHQSRSAHVAGSYLVTAHAQYESANASMPANQQPQASCSGGQQTYSLALYDDPHSLFCAKVKIAMVAKSIKWTSLSVPCGSTRSEEYRARVPLGKIPALVATLESGAEIVLQESEVISEWLEEAWPSPSTNPRVTTTTNKITNNTSSSGGSSSSSSSSSTSPAAGPAAADPVSDPHAHVAHVALMPTHPMSRAQVRLLCRFHDLYLEPALRRLYPHTAPSVRDPRVVSAAVQNVLQQLHVLEQLLCDARAAVQAVQGPPVQEAAAGIGSSGGADSAAAELSAAERGYSFAVGHQFTLADCAFPAWMYYAELLWPVLAGGPLDYSALGLPAVAAWRASLWRHSAVQSVLQELVPAGEEWLAGKLKQ